MAAALGRFIFRSSDKCLPFFKILRKCKKEGWNEECDKAFADLKGYLERVPLLSAPKHGEELALYLAISPSAVSAVLTREDGPDQKPVYYVSKTLLDAETRYLLLEKVALALVMAARKLRHYFQAHTIVVRTTFPLKTILQRADFSGRMTKWAIELSEFDIKYELRTAIKAQALADFIAEFTGGRQSPT